MDIIFGDKRVVDNRGGVYIEHYHDERTDKTEKQDVRNEDITDAIVLPEKDKEPSPSSPAISLPPELATPRAMQIWRVLQQKGWVDEQYRPTLSRAKTAILAHTMADVLHIRNMWSVFEDFWQMNSLSSAYTKGMCQNNISTFLKEIEDINI